MAPKTIFIAAGGTGGHLFPAVYIAESIRASGPQFHIVGIGAGRPLEAKIYGSVNLEYKIVPTVGLKDRGVSGALNFLVTLPKAILKTITLIHRYRPEAMIGVGGYVTVLPVLFGWLLKIPTVIHEAEMKPGLANLFLSLFANRVTTAFQNCQMPSWANVSYTGHPVRQGLVAARRTQPLSNSEKPKNILIVGGSQGAQSLDDALPLLSKIIKEHSLSIWHQCRPQNVAAVQATYAAAGISAKVVPFIDDVIEAYTWADIIISRSGAGSVSELAVINKPIIFVPFPFAQADHQTKNALTLVEIGKARLCPENKDSAAEFQTRLGALLLQLLDIDRYNQVILAPGAKNNQDAATRIAGEMFSLIVAK